MLQQRTIIDQPLPFLCAFLIYLNSISASDRTGNECPWGNVNIICHICIFTATFAKVITPKVEHFQTKNPQTEPWPVVERQTARHRVSDAGARSRISRLYDDEWPLLQSNHTQVLGVIQRFEKRAITGPGRVTQAQHSIFPPTYLQQQQDAITILQKHFREIQNVS